MVVPSASQWCILAIESDSLEVINNILLSASSKGSLDIETTCTNYIGNYNLLNDRITVNQGSSYINFAEWQRLGNDLNSILVKDNATVFTSLLNHDYHLAQNSVALNSGSAVVFLSFSRIWTETYVHRELPTISDVTKQKVQQV